ncbi:ABC transporter substrate-binding protein [Streptomyces longwoodensis]|uniref:ABC transporter substrate-binding protein n=1 Tax=Streptomyces longwoodensis TaxID=68231 RepID=UPI0037F4AA33
MSPGEETTEPCRSRGHALTARNVTVSYDGTDVVHDAALALRPGQVTALVGPNGSGKSSLLRTLATRGEPSTDTVASLAPDLVVATTDLPAAAVKQLRSIAPVLQVRSADASDQIGQMRENLDLIARATGTTAEAQKAEKAFDGKVAEGRKALADAGLDGRKLAFADGYVASHQVTVRPYTSGSLVGAVNEAIGLENAWTVEGDASYGLATTDVEGLSTLGDVQFAYIDNNSQSDPFAEDLAKNPVWKGLPFVEKGNVHRLPDGIWMFGGHRSMEAYIDAVVDALTK